MATELGRCPTKLVATRGSMADGCVKADAAAIVEIRNALLRDTSIFWIRFVEKNSGQTSEWSNYLDSAFALDI